MAIKIVAADAQPIFLLGLTKLFSRPEGIDLVAYCVTASKTREVVKEHQPDILMLDLNLPDDKDFQLVRDLQKKYEQLKIIILSAALSDDQTIEALRLGVEGMVLKNMPLPLLVQCVRKVATGGQWLEKKSIGHAFEVLLKREAGARRVATILTERETEIMCLVAEGLSNGQIAEKLVLAPGTVKIHVHNIYSKLGLKNRVDLTLYAQSKGLV